MTLTCGWPECAAAGGLAGASAARVHAGASGSTAARGAESSVKRIDRRVGRFIRGFLTRGNGWPAGGPSPPAAGARRAYRYVPELRGIIAGIVRPMVAPPTAGGL